MNTEIKMIRKFCCSTCGVQGHNKNNTKFHPAVPVVKDRFTCETCESKCDRLIDYSGLRGEEWQVCEDCEIKFDEERIQMVDDPDMPNIYPYKKCCECEERSSCGSYNENRDWICESCAPEEETCFKCGAQGKFGCTHFLAIVDGVENMYCEDCDGDMIHCESCNEVGCDCHSAQ